VDGLANVVRQEFKIDPFGNYLFLFCNRARNRLKGLMWDRNGFCLFYKRLDGEGARFRWPKDPEKTLSIEVSQLKQLLDGFSIVQPKGFGDITARDF
jgi:transposase